MPNDQMSLCADCGATYSSTFCCFQWKCLLIPSYGTTCMVYLFIFNSAGNWYFFRWMSGNRAQSVSSGWLRHRIWNARMESNWREMYMFSCTRTTITPEGKFCRKKNHGYMRKASEPCLKCVRTHFFFCDGFSVTAQHRKWCLLLFLARPLASFRPISLHRGGASSLSLSVQTRKTNGRIRFILLSTFRFESRKCHFLYPFFSLILWSRRVNLYSGSESRKPFPFCMTARHEKKKTNQQKGKKEVSKSKCVCDTRKQNTRSTEPNKNKSNSRWRARDIELSLSLLCSLSFCTFVFFR